MLGDAVEYSQFQNEKITYNVQFICQAIHAWLFFSHNGQAASSGHWPAVC